ncbi:MAG: hypothetical protein WAU21_08565 [Chitinophagales bacterium]|nr:hypothetical protein [Bacteroidota bacterium]MBK8488300.1 hypothetical protein [Bacteroidota bacterium]MBK8681918.1 hypothetical protein [Bacteroidota bacterium]
MFFHTIRLLFIVLLGLLITSSNNLVFSQNQITLKIEFSGDQNQVNETKKILSKYDIYFVLSDDEQIKSSYNKDSLLIIENISVEQLERIKSQKFPLVKLQNKRHCFYSLLSTNFFNSSTIRNLIIYRIPKDKRIIGLFTVSLKSKELASKLSYTRNGLSISQPISMIPCSKYKGEYDNGLDGAEHR